MTIAFDASIDDLMVFQDHYYRTNRMLRRTRFVVLPAIYIIVILFDTVIHRGRIDFVLVGIFGCLYALSLIYLKWFFSRKIKRMYCKPENRIYLGPQTMTFDEDGVHAHTDNSDNKYRWQSFIKWVEVNNYILIYLSEISAYVIPCQKLAPGQTEELKAILGEHIAPQTKK